MQKYKVNISSENWKKLKLLSIKKNKPMYKIFEEEILTFFLQNNKEEKITKQKPLKELKGIYLEDNYKRVLKEVAWEYYSNVTSLVNYTIKFYFENNKI